MSTDKAAVMNKWKCHCNDLYIVESCDINVSDHEITETVDTGLSLVITENVITMAKVNFKMVKSPDVITYGTNWSFEKQDCH